MVRVIMNLKLWVKMIIPPAIAISFLILLAVVSYKGIASQNATINDLFNVRFEAHSRASVIMQKMVTVHKDMYRYLGMVEAGASEDKVKQVGDGLPKALGEVKELVTEALHAGALNSQENEVFQSFSKEIEDYDELMKKSISMATDDASVALTMMYPVEDKFRVLGDKMQAMLDLEHKLSKDEYDMASVNYRFIIQSFALVLGISIVLSFAVSILIATLATLPVKQAIGAIEEIAEGDLTRELRTISRDEIGRLAVAVDSMRMKMGDAVGECSEMATGLSDSASNQAASIEETSSSVEEIAVTTKHNAMISEQANTLMSRTKEEVEKANASMADLSASMREIAMAGSETQTLIKSIDEISFRTNLLALNAAVEAARAGETGAGFAIVADEVRNLAKQAAEAAQNTSHLVGKILSRVNLANELVQTTAGTFSGVAEGTNKVVEMIHSVSSGSLEQTRGLDHISSAVAQMNAATQKTAATAQELASIMARFKTERSGVAAKRTAPV